MKPVREVQLPVFDEERVRRQMVILGRESRGYSQSELARIMGVTQGELSRVEAGLRGASEQFLALLSEGLHYPPSFFTSDERVYGAGLGDLYHRKRQDVPVKVLSMLHARVNIYRIHISRLLRAADIPECRIPHLELDGSPEEIEEAARQVRAFWHLPSGPIENLCATIEDAGGILVRFDFETDRVDAVSQWIPPLPPLFFLNSRMPLDRLRWTLAHELGHLVLHNVAHANLDPTGGPEAEKEANAFASELLLPASEVARDLTDLTLPRLAILKPIWRVAMSALLTRAEELGVITKRHAKTLWSQLSRLKYRKDEPVKLETQGEEPETLHELTTLYRDALEYSTSELAKLVDLCEDELRSLYFPSGRGLRLVS